MLDAWLAGLKVDEAARARARSAWLQRQAEEEGTFVGVLADLAERERAVVIDTTNGRRHQGILRVVGQDFCGLSSPRGVDTLVHYDAVVGVRPAPGEQGATGDRLVEPVVTFVDALAAMAGMGARVVAVPRTGEPTVGELRSVGTDIVTLRLDDRSTAYVRLTALGELSVVESG